MKKKYVYRTQKELDGLRWTSRVIDFGVSLTVASALNELTTAYIMLRERKDLFRHHVKHLANGTMQAATNLRASMFGVMMNRGFFDTYSDRVIDLAEQDITLFRISIKQTLDSKRYKDADLVSYTETARTLLEMAVEHFKSVIQAAREEYGVNYAKAFCEFNAQDVLMRWQKVCDMLYDTREDIDLNTQRTLGFFEKIGRSFADGDYVDVCLKEAMEENPDFVNDIIVKDKVNHDDGSKKEDE